LPERQETAVKGVVMTLVRRYRRWRVLQARARLSYAKRILQKRIIKEGTSTRKRIGNEERRHADRRQGVLDRRHGDRRHDDQ
jgi:hypothetical protein